MSKSEQNLPARRKLIDKLLPTKDTGVLRGVFSTTFEFQQEFFETDFLPTLLGMGAWDSRKWASRIALEKAIAGLRGAEVFQDASRYFERPRSLRIGFNRIRVEGGILHAKVILCVYSDAIRVVVGSANLTESGYRKNRETAVVLFASERDNDDVHLIRQLLSEMPEELVTAAGATPAVLAEARELLDRWEGGPEVAGSRFIWSSRKAPLHTAFVRTWPAGEQIKSIRIVSPFWSEERVDGPVSQLVRSLRERGGIHSDAVLTLHTSATAVAQRPGFETEYISVLPESFQKLSTQRLGIRAVALAVDPRVPPAEVDLGDPDQVPDGKSQRQPLRDLHAKVVLVEGDRSTLAYVGSANFTSSGWGFGRGANLEAGVVLLRTGSRRAELNALVPSGIGDPVELAAAAPGSLAEPMPDDPERPWPAFLRAATLVSDGKSRLALKLEFDQESIRGPWKVSVIGDGPEVQSLADGGVETKVAFRVVALSEQTLERLLVEQHLVVSWWEVAMSCRFPINVEHQARQELPVAPGAGLPGEGLLISYYQGKIHWSDMFPDPDEKEREDANADRPSTHEVDTSAIQSYQIREFVEALQGIRDDLNEAAAGSEGAMRLALLGNVSPVALAGAIKRAFDEKRRTAVASAFQLVELLSCLADARAFAEGDLVPEWLKVIADAERRISGILSEIRPGLDRDSASSKAFRRYEAGVRKLSARAGNKP